MVQPGPISGHPLFGPFLAVWFAALFGLGVAVLPAALIGRALAGSGIAADPTPGRIAASAFAAVIGAGLGWGLAHGLRRRGARDPRPFRDDYGVIDEDFAPPPPPRRPLRVHEDLATELGEGAGDGSSTAPLDQYLARSSAISGRVGIVPAIEYTQFDPSPPDQEIDPVHAFVSRQTGQRSGSQPARPGPDHQAELRAALDKLAAQRRASAPPEEPS